MTIRWSVAAAIIAGSTLAPGSAWAHVKWFCSYDITVPPLPLREVVNTTFLWIGALFAVLLLLGFMLDRLAHNSAWDAMVDRFLAPLEHVQAYFMRIGVGAFFVCLWVKGGIILTPELTTESTTLPWLQLLIAIGTIWRRTCLLSGLGIVALYAYATVNYGVFHLVDYPIFLGIAVYLMLTASDRPKLLALRLPIMYAAAGFTLMWAGIEKFGYPYWTLPLLAEHSRITFGIDFDVFMTLAGFVEFALAYFLITGTAILRLGSFYLLFIFLTAIIDFGKIDAIGHLLIIIALGIMTLGGKTRLQHLFVQERRGIFAQASIMTGLHFVFMAGFFALYYGIQSLEYQA
ncbi:MAG: hypothetical protein HY060_17210 [Proteobacteria bacterium]|nr:hypothetical protein [Pseudomonadota bacterium]